MQNPFESLVNMLNPATPYNTAAAGAREAQQQANQLSDLQWQRQMQGLGQATGYVDQLQALYNSMYSPGGGKTAAGGSAPRAPSMGMGGPVSGMTMPKTPPASPPGGPNLGGYTADALDFVPGVGTANRFGAFMANPSVSTGARAAASLVPGANATYDAGKALWNKVF